MDGMRHIHVEPFVVVFLKAFTLSRENSSCSSTLYSSINAKT